MYFSIGILLLILLCFVLCSRRRHIAIKKVQSMSCEEKCELISSILTPFGYCYIGRQDIISTCNDAWQRTAGYTALFDRAALHFHMVFDALPIYFDYCGRTWLIELWKGQYGTNTGAEIGIYYADTRLTRDELPTAHFNAVDDEDRLAVTYTLSRKGRPIARVSGVTWWLTAFLTGMFSQPAWLAMDIAIRFPNPEMQRCFIMSLQQLDPCPIRFHCCGNEVHLCYRNGCPQSPVCPQSISWLRRLHIKWVQFCNTFCCRLYCMITRPFTDTLDRILYLYELLPFILRRMLRHLKGVIH